MILADKIIENRKKNGWSQEELAEKLDVSRQSVSKWEMAQAIPDMKKIIQMSELFGVSTDYLVKEEIENDPMMDSAPLDIEVNEAVRTVSLEEANRFLEYNEKAARTVSTGVMLCILSPVILILMSGLADAGKISLNEAVAGLGGTALLLIIVAIAVAMFIMSSMRGKEFSFLENEPIDTAYGVSGLAKERRLEYAQTHSRLLIIGVMLCILATVPLLLILMTKYSNNTDVLPAFGVAILLSTVAAGVKMCVLTGIRQDGFNKLLEEGDYSRLNKRASRFDGIYWGIALAVYLGWSLITHEWHITWVIWPIAGVLFIAYKELMRAISRTHK